MPKKKKKRKGNLVSPRPHLVPVRKGVEHLCGLPLSPGGVLQGGEHHALPEVHPAAALHLVVVSAAPEEVLQVGLVAVAVAVSAPRRADALEAELGVVVAVLLPLLLVVVVRVEEDAELVGGEAVHRVAAM